MANSIIIAYDISDNKTRTKFAKFLGKYGVRIQFSIFEIQNSQRVLEIVQNGIETKFKKQFEYSDSVYIFKTNVDEAIKYGSPNLLDDDLIIM
jgi:CRISPR-associated protein Cas2